jgi:hypothetical protein
MKPGIYENMSYEDYHAIGAVRASQLKGYRISARRGRHCELNPPMGRALSLGNAIHTAILEPGEYPSRYVVLGPCEAEIQSGKRKGELCGGSGLHISGGKSYCGRHAPAKPEIDERVVLTLPENKTVMNLAAALQERPDILRYLDQDHYTERVLVWQDPDMGVLCKARIDHQLHSGTILDLKSTSARDLTPRTLMGVVYNFAYHQSLAWYRRGCQVLGEPPGDVMVVWLQTVEDNDVAAYWLDDDALDQGEREAMDCLASLIKARETGVCPGVQTDCTHATLGLPEWAMDDTEVVFNG